MISCFNGDVYVKGDVDIIFNPVGVRDNDKGYIKRVKNLYPKAYMAYQERVWMYNRNELIGDVQLVNIGHKRFILNSYCKEYDGMINKLALCKTLVELCNLAYEYRIIAGIEDRLGVKDDKEGELINTIIWEVFKNIDVQAYVYSRFGRYQNM